LPWTDRLNNHYRCRSTMYDSARRLWSIQQHDSHHQDGPGFTTEPSKSAHASNSPLFKRENGCNCAQSATQMLGDLDSNISTIAELSVDGILSDQL
jgi:hypothetical protein